MSTAQRICNACFYWCGMAATLACLTFILAGNTESFWRVEHKGFPLSWAFAAAAILAFLGAEVCEVAWPLPSRAAGPNPQLSTEWANPSTDTADA